MERPKMQFGGKDLYPDMFVKAAACFESLARNHAFVDGNKRTAVLAAGRFLFLNGYDLTASNRTLEQFTLRVAMGELGVPMIAAWLKRHSQKIKR